MGEMVVMHEVVARITDIPLVKRFWASVLVVYVYLALFVHRSYMWIDLMLLVWLAIGFGFVAGVMIWATAIWNARSLGIMGLSIGGLSLSVALIIDISNVGFYGIEETFYDLARSFLFVSLPLLCGSLAIYVRNRIRWRRKGDAL